MATKVAVDRWFSAAVGRSMNPDNAYGLQCKDVADDYCVALFGNWVNTVKPGNGKDVFANASATYFTKIANDFTKPDLIPQYGDIINWGTSVAVPEGHVAVVKSATSNTVTVIEQDGYLQTPAKIATHSYILPNGAKCIGWLRPKLEEIAPLATVEQIKVAYLELLERAADDGGLAHYQKYTIDFVRADLKSSQEYKTLQANKAFIAKAKADAEAKAIALAAEEARIKAEQVAAEKARIEAEAKIKAAEEEKRLAEEAAKAAELAAKKLAQDEENDNFIIWLKAIFEAIAKFLTSWKK